MESGAARVAIAVRTSPPITSREIFGIPVQLLGILLGAAHRTDDGKHRRIEQKTQYEVQAQVQQFRYRDLDKARKLGRKYRRRKRNGHHDDRPDGDLGKAQLTEPENLANKEISGFHRAQHDLDHA